MAAQLRVWYREHRDGLGPQFRVYPAGTPDVQLPEGVCHRQDAQPGHDLLAAGLIIPVGHSRTPTSSSAVLSSSGATSIEDPMDTPYGDRRAMVRDPFGNIFFQIAHHR